MCIRDRYWDHKYIRVLVDQEVPALGYTTVVLYEKGLDSYPVYLQTNEQVTRCYDDVVLENEQTIVTISAETGRIKSLAVSYTHLSSFSVTWSRAISSLREVQTG